MKSRILHKNNQNLLLGLIAVSTLAFTSCSRSLTSLRNTKELQNEQVLTNPSSICEKQMATAPKIENQSTPVAPPTSTALMAPISNQATISAPMAKKHSLFALRFVSHKNQIIGKVKDQVAGISTFAKRSTVAASYKHAAQPMDMIRRAIICFVISLIFYLVGALFFWPVGYVFYIIATIFLILGIIYLLFGLMREL